MFSIMADEKQPCSWRPSSSSELLDEKPPVNDTPRDVFDKYPTRVRVSDTQTCHSLAISRTLRSIPPAHYLFKVEPVSMLLMNTSIEKYESGSFEVGGYKWRLCLYPKGIKKCEDRSHISLYLEISDTENLPLGWDVTVNFKLFVFNHVHDKFLTVQDADGKLRHFNAMKTKFGFAQFLPLDVLKDPCNEYVIDDSCIFGAEVSVMKCRGKGECLSMIKDPSDGTFTWVIENFSRRNEDIIHSETFNVKDVKWKLKLYPRGDQKAAKNKRMSLFLELGSLEKLHQKKLYAEFELSIKDQSCGGSNKPFVPKSAHSWFSDLDKSWGFSDMVSLCDLHDKSNYFILNDTLILEAKINVMMYSKNI